MSRHVSETRNYELWGGEIAASKMALQSVVEIINNSSSRTATEFKFLDLVEIIIQYSESLYLHCHDTEHSLIHLNENYKIMHEISSFISSVIGKQESVDDFYNNDEQYYTSLLNYIVSKLGNDIQNFYDFVPTSQESTNFDSEIQEESEADTKSPEPFYKEMLEIQILKNKLKQHMEFIDRSSVLKGLIGKDYLTIISQIKEKLELQPTQSANDIEIYKTLLQQFDKIIWSNESEYNYQLILLAQEMKGLHITRYFPILLSEDISKRVKQSLNTIERAHDKNTDVELLIDTIKALRNYLRNPQSRYERDELNECLDAFPKNSPIKFYLKALLITTILLGLATAAIFICIQCGVDFSSLMDPVNKLTNSLSSIFPPLKNFGLTIYNGMQQTAFVLPKLMGGDAVPIWSLVAGAACGSVLGLAGGKAAKLIITNTNMYYKDDDISSEFSDNNSTSAVLGDDYDTSSEFSDDYGTSSEFNDDYGTSSEFSDDYGTSSEFSDDYDASSESNDDSVKSKYDSRRSPFFFRKSSQIEDMSSTKSLTIYLVCTVTDPKTIDLAEWDLRTRFNNTFGKISGKTIKSQNASTDFLTKLTFHDLDETDSINQNKLISLIDELKNECGFSKIELFDETYQKIELSAADEESLTDHEDLTDSDKDKPKSP